MHLVQLACASFDRYGLLVVEEARTWAYPSAIMISIWIQIEPNIDIPSCLSHPYYLRPVQDRDQIAIVPRTVNIASHAGRNQSLPSCLECF